MKAFAFASLALLGCAPATIATLKIDPAEARQLEAHARLTDPGLGFDPRVCTAPPDPMPSPFADVSAELGVPTSNGDPFLAERCRIARLLESLGEPVLSSRTAALSVRLLEETATGWRVVRLAETRHGAWAYLHDREGGTWSATQKALGEDRWHELLAHAREALKDGAPQGPRSHLVLELARAGEYQVRDLDEPTAAMQSFARELEALASPP